MTDTAVQLKHMTAAVRFKAPAEGAPVGEFEAIVSVFNNVDSYGDVVMPGAFADDLVEWAASGDPIPVLWSHDWLDPDSHLGVVTEASETDEGLLIKGVLDVADNPKAERVARLMKDRRVKQFSFAYDVLEGSWGKRDDKDVYELRKLHIHEVGPTLLGVNRATRLLDAKAPETERITIAKADEAEVEGAPAGVPDEPNPRKARALRLAALFTKEN